MHAIVASHAGHPRRMAVALPRMALRPGLALAALLPAVSWLALVRLPAATLVPLVWPACAVAVGAFLLTDPRRHWWQAPVLLLLGVGAHLLAGLPYPVAVGYALACLLAAWTVRCVLVGRTDGDRPALLDQRDVGRLFASVAAGAVVGASTCAVTAFLTGTGDPWLAWLAAFGSQAAALVVLLPLFLPTTTLESPAPARERVAQVALTVGGTMLVFAFSDVPLLVFAVLPLFAWHAFRATLREATVVLTLVAALATGVTLAEMGPVWELGARYDLPAELVGGVLQLFLVDCGLILLPLSVMVTQQRLATRAAAAGREMLERLVDSATGMAVIATDREGRIVQFNPAAAGMFGVEAQSALGGVPDQFFGEAELQRQATLLRAQPSFTDICRACVALGEGARLWRFRGPAGRERTMRMTLTAIPGALGELTGYLATAEDVTEREAAHRALLETLRHERTAMERLRELERVKGDFVSTISHELRTPITSIVGYTEILGDGAFGELTPSQREILERVDRNGRRLLHLVEDLLTLSEIDDSRLRIEPVTSDLRTVVAQAHAAVGPQLAGRSLGVTVDLPAAPMPQMGDPVQLERMVVNLLSNAVKFTPDGGSVEVLLRAEDNVHELVVRDTGVGIPAAEQPELFNRFVRSSTASAHAIQGTGLGLTIVRAIVSLHGGDVRLWSAAGEGTAVTVRLPQLLDDRPSTVVA